MSYTIVFEIKNKKEDYVNCAQAIEQIINQNYNFNKASNIKIIKTTNNNMPFNKLEEPLDGRNISSSFCVVEPTKHKTILEDNKDNIKFHIRVKFPQDINIENLHYLALLISKYKFLVNEKNLSVFLIPRTSCEYPFEKNGQVDIELFSIASTHLRALIDNENKGTIFGVYRKKENDGNIVKALDFKKDTKETDSFPIIPIDGSIVFDKQLEEQYISAPKAGNVQEREVDLVNKKINNYSLLFKPGLANQYLKKAKQMRKNQRFGFAAYEKPNIALCDYVFETAYKLLSHKLLSANISISEIEYCLTSKLLDTNIISFAIFSFITDFSNVYNEDKQTILSSLNSTLLLSCKISSGLEQIIQNSVQHSSHKISIFSFLKKNNNLKIIVSDLSKNSVLDTFKINLKNEDNFVTDTLEQSSLFDTLSKNKQYYKKMTPSSTEHLNLNFFFNDFNKENLDDNTLNQWFEFRQSDSSAHIGMSLFSNAIKRCDGYFSMVSDNRYTGKTNDNSIFYSSKPVESSNEIHHFPGTEYNITLPMTIQSVNYSTNIAQFNSTNYIENYESFADFIDYEVDSLNYTINRTFLNETYQKVKKLQIGKAIDKFSMQLLWTNYWLTIFDHIELGENKLYSIDYSKIEINNDYVDNNYARETIIKGFIDSLGIFASKHSSKNLNIAFINITKNFMELFKEISLTLSLKVFPSNIQIFLSDYDEEHQIHLLGNNYGLAIQNSYLLSLESYYESYDGGVYYDIDNIIKPFKGIIVERPIKVVPFLGILKSKFSSTSMFFSKVAKLADKDIINENGYKFTDNHTRLGNKVHIHSFYEMSHLFHRTVMANHVAFSIIRDLKSKATIDILKDSVLFYGYASYSQAILMSLTKILESYRMAHNIPVSDETISYSIYQYNLQYEANPGDIQIYLRNSSLLNCPSKVQVIQIVPISSTLTTFAKMWKKFAKEYNSQRKFFLNENYTIFWVRDVEKNSITSKTTEHQRVSDLEKKYFDIDDNGVVTSKFSDLENKKTINWILVGRVKWEKPEKCEKCFPKQNLLKEIPIIETDPTSTVPAQQIYSKRNTKEIDSIVSKKIPFEDIEKYTNLYGNVHYGHFKRGKNHYQYFIDTQTYFASVSPMVKNWLSTLRERESKTPTLWPTIDIIFSPSHNTNVGFSQYVNAYYFNGAAEIISINEDKEFNSNFCCEYAMLKNTIQRLVDDFNLSYNFRNGQAAIKYNYRPVRFIFVDDNIITGDSFRKASKLLQSLLPEEIINNYGTNVFEKAFVLIDRMSLSSRNTYILPKENFHAFCKINIPSMRKHGDSCVCCKLKTQAYRLYKRSSTQFASNYWRSKIEKLEEKSFETINSEDAKKVNSRKAYLRTIFSHLIKDFFKNDINNNSAIFSSILQLLNFFSGTPIESLKDFDSFEYLSSYMPIIAKPYIELDEQFYKEAIITIIKTISRPFFTYNQTVKQEMLRCLIILSETILLEDPNFEETNDSLNTAIEISKNIKGLFNSPQDLLEFMQNVVLDGLTDLHSTYLLRYETMKKILNFINKLNTDELGFQRIKEFFLHYSICIQRLVDESNDETRSLRLEYLMVTCNDDFSESYAYDIDNRKTFYDNFLYKLNDHSLKEDVKNAFEIFCNEIFLGNGRILYDGIEKSYTDKKFTLVNKSSYDNYFIERWETFKSLDNNWVNICKEGNDSTDYKKQDTITNQIALFELLHSSTQQKSNWDDGIVENRYRDLLTCIGNMIAEKYRINPDNMRLALLTCSKKLGKQSGNISVKDLVIESCVEYEDGKPIGRKQDFDSNAKYIIKKRILSALDNQKLNEFGYYIVNENLSLQNCKNDDEVTLNKTFYDIEKTNHRKPYFILKFQNKSENGSQTNISKSKTIVPVYLYFSYLIDETSGLERVILPQLIIRDILTYRKGIINYLEEDFTTDVMERYAISIDQEAILKNEKVMSHTPMDQDKKELNYCLSDNTDLKYIYNEKIKNWIIVRSFCNTIIARLYNRVFRNINRSFEKILEEYTNLNRETYKLYVPSLSNGGNDGKNFPLNDIMQVVPHKLGQNKGVYKLFEEIITFEIDENVKKSSAYVYNFDGIDYAYNLDYVKNIIYRICFDALRFSYGAGAEQDNFIARISHHYENKTNEIIKKENSGNKWFNTETHPICFVSFSVESSNSSNFDWLVIKNELYKSYENNIEYIKKKMEDPLDFTDGHMSLITAKEFFAKMLENDDVKYLEEMYDYEIKNKKSYFVTKLPIIKKGGSI